MKATRVGGEVRFGAGRVSDNLVFLNSWRIGMVMSMAKPAEGEGIWLCVRGGRLEGGKGIRLEVETGTRRCFSRSQDLKAQSKMPSV